MTDELARAVAGSVFVEYLRVFGRLVSVKSSLDSL
jgi:hypothetical protein